MCNFTIHQLIRQMMEHRYIISFSRSSTENTWELTTSDIEKKNYFTSETQKRGKIINISFEFLRADWVRN